MLITSPLFFVTPADVRWKAIDASTGDAFARLAPEIFQVASYFLTPCDRSQAEQSGLRPEAIDAALDARIVLNLDDPSLRAMRRWEDNRWSRMAYLAFTQQDLGYAEPTADDPPIASLIDFRRRSIQAYLDISDYPSRHLNDPLEAVVLPEQSRRPDIDLDSLISRRSVRSFSPGSIDLQTFTSILWDSTHFVRVADESKKGGDPFYLLNSFYTWLEIYVVVQGVEGLRRGAYQYDMNDNKLLAIAWDVKDESILPCIQHQNWIDGGGFCVFIAVDWMRYLWVYRHSRAYINLVIQLGEIGQEILQSAYHNGLAGWPTPAVHESNCAGLLKLDSNRRDAMYFLKIGKPLDEQGS